MKIFTKIICSRSNPSQFIDPTISEFNKEINSYRKERGIPSKDVKWMQSLSKDQLVLTAIVG